MADILVIAFAALVLTPIITIVLPYSLMFIFTRARRKGYRSPQALLIAAAGWSIGTIGAGIWEMIKFRNGRESRIDVVEIPAIVLVVVITVTAILLVSLPRGNSRVFGPRPTHFPWHRVAYIVAGVFLLVPAIIVLLWAAGKVDVLWVWAGLIVCVPFSLGAVWYAIDLVRYESRIGSTISIEEYLNQDPRPPVLYLRPFKMDYYVYAERDERNWTFEHYFCGALREIGPFVALGNPEDYFTNVGGAVRLYTSDLDWVQKLDELARQSCCIVVETARSDNLRLEYEYVRREGMQEKLFVFTGHPEWVERRWLKAWQRLRFGALHVGWQKFSEDLAILGYHLGSNDPGLGSVLTFDADGRAVLLTSQATRAAEFIEPVKAWIASRKKTGRCVPTSCYRCGREFHVFASDRWAVRARGCADCGEGLNAVGRVIKRFNHRHFLLLVWIVGISLILSPILFIDLLPRESWEFEAACWLAAPVIVAELFGVVYLWQLAGDRRIARLNRKLANAGDPIAMANLGVLYAVGRGVSRNYAQAADWLLKAAEAGDPGAMMGLADMHERGIGELAADAQTAIHWYEKAASLGSDMARENLDRLRTGTH